MIIPKTIIFSVLYVLQPSGEQFLKEYRCTDNVCKQEHWMHPACESIEVKSWSPRFPGYKVEMTCKKGANYYEAVPSLVKDG